MSANSRGLMRFEHTREKVESEELNETESEMWQQVRRQDLDREGPPLRTFLSPPGFLLKIKQEFKILLKV